MVKVSSWLSGTVLGSRWLVGKQAEKVVGKPAKQGESNTFFTGRLQLRLWLEGEGWWSWMMVARARHLRQRWTKTGRQFLLFLFFFFLRASSDLRLLSRPWCLVHLLPRSEKNMWGLFIDDDCSRKGKDWGYPQTRSSWGELDMPTGVSSYFTFLFFFSSAHWAQLVHINVINQIDHPKHIFGY